MSRFKGTKGVILLIVMIGLIVGYYFYLSNRAITENAEEDVLVSAVQEILLRDMEKNYPPSPKEVIKYYSLITQCFYNDKLTDEELDALAFRAQELYDAELIANKTQEQYLIDLREDIDKFAKDELKISSFTTSASTDVEYFSESGYEWARLYCTYSVRQRTSMLSTTEVFLLRKDDAGHWKIYGWDLAENVADE